MPTIGFEIIRAIRTRIRISKIDEDFENPINREFLLGKVDAYTRLLSLSLSLPSKVHSPCRLIWSASISPERLPVGSEPIYPARNVNEDGWAVQTRTWLDHLCSAG